MIEEIFKFFSKYVQLSEEDKRIIAENSFFKFYPAGQQLLKEGQQAQHCFFVVKGLLRSYYLEDGEEKVTEFHDELSPINSVSYVTGKPSTYYISCIEDSIITISDEKRSAEFFERLPAMKDLGLKFLNDLNAKQKLTFDDFRNLRPKQRYEKFLAERPDLINRVPQYMIASYLGIQPQSLSRIRKRMRDHKI